MSDEISPQETGSESSQNRPSNEADQKKQKPYVAPPCGPPVFHLLPPPVDDEEKARGRREEAREDKRFKLELWGFTVGFVLLFIFGYQGCEMQAQLQEMQRTRMEDERAWIDPYSFSTSIENSNGMIRYVLHVKNDGKTPALHVEDNFQIFLFFLLCP